MDVKNAISALLRDEYQLRPDILQVENGILQLLVRNLEEAEAKKLTTVLASFVDEVGGKHEENAKPEGGAHTVRAVIDLRHVAAAK